MIDLYHGSYEEQAPIIKYGVYALSLDNIFDGIFASDDVSVAESHAPNIYVYKVNSVADNQDLDCDKAIEIIQNELEVSREIAIEIVTAVAYDYGYEDGKDIYKYLHPRADLYAGEFAIYGWEIQRLRGVIARDLGFDAVKCKDEHGTSYLIVNNKLLGKPYQVDVI